MKVHLVIIDPQNDFCDPTGALYVPGSKEDMDRLAACIQRNLHKWDDIHVTMDSHRLIDIAHPLFWKDSAGNHPPNFTVITVDDVEKGRWVASMPSFQEWGLSYVKELAAKGKYQLVVWPVHCRIGSWGHNIFPSVFDALTEWEG